MVGIIKITKMEDLQETLSEYIQEQFEVFQLAEDDIGPGAASRRAASIKKHVQILVLNHGIDKLNLVGKNDENNHTSTDTEVDFSTLLVPLLLQYVDAALTMEVNAENRDAVQRVLDLASALACMVSLSSFDDDKDAVQTILDRAQTFSTVLLERLRCRACNLLGYLASHLDLVIRRQSKNRRRTEEQSGDPRDEDSKISAWVKKCLMHVEGALVPRLTDKSQSVRQCAIQAVGSLLAATSCLPTSTAPSSSFKHHEEGDDDDDDEGSDDDDDDENSDDDDEKNDNSDNKVLEALLWTMWHDPSVANRVGAIQAVPISTHTVDHIIARVRDVKDKVRVAALDVLRLKVDPRNVMNEDQFCEIVQSGLTERCEATKMATTKLICSKWMKAAKFDPVELLRLMGATANEEECESAMKVVLETVRSGDHTAIQELSDPEKRSFFSNIEKSMIQLKDSTAVFDEYQLFYSRLACTTAKGSTHLSYTQKEDLLSKTAPDIPTLCDLFQKHLQRFVESIQEEDQETEDQECFVCLQLLQLAKVAGLQEEGSRRHFANVMVKVLANIGTPDDLVEDCVEALRAAHDENEFDFFNAILLILAGLTSSFSSPDGDDFVLDDEKETERTMRVLFLFSVVLENAPSSLFSHSLFETMVKIILSAVASPKVSIREVGISCFGKLGFFSEEKTVASEFKQILLKIATNESEVLQCRGQALLALSDWAMLFSEVLKPHENGDGTTLSLAAVVEEMMTHSNTSVSAIAAEVAAKLLFSLRVSDDKLLGRLLVCYLDPNRQNKVSEEGDANAKEVGSPIRLQQLLSLFFPAFCLKSDACRNALLASVGSALEIAIEPPKSKTKKRPLVFPLVKICEFVCSVVEAASSASAKAIQTTAGGNAEDDSCVTLSASLHVAKFLVRNERKLTVTQLRSLCKFLGGQDFDASANEKPRLSNLKGCMEELSFISDSSSLKALRPLMERISDVQTNEVKGDERAGDAREEVSDDKTVGEESDCGNDAEESTGETTVEDSLMDSFAALTVNYSKENPPKKISNEGTSRLSRRSSTQSHVSVLESLGSPNL